MIQITPQMRILVAVEPVDFRKGIDGLAALCRNVLQKDPFEGNVFVFRNRRGTSIKILVYDGQGFWLFQKRLSEGKFKWRPKNVGEKINALAAKELQILLWNGNPELIEMSPDWRTIIPENNPLR